MKDGNIKKTQLNDTKVNEAIYNLRKQFRNKRIVTVILKDSNIDFFENVLAAMDDVLYMENICIMIVEPVPIESFVKKEIVQKIELLRKKHGQYAVFHKTPETEIAYIASLAVGDLGIFVEEYSLCFKELIDFARLNKSHILIEQSSTSPIRAIKVNFNSKKDVVETITKCLAKESTYYDENQQIISSLQSNDFISRLLSQEKSYENTQIPEYLTEGHIHSIIESFKKAQTRAIILDYSGTLTETDLKPELAFPNTELKVLLKNLGQIPNCDLVICTGHTKQTMDNFFPYHQKDQCIATSKSQRPGSEQTVFEINMTIYADDAAVRRLKDKWVEGKFDLSFRPMVYNIMKKTQEILPGSNIMVKPLGLEFFYETCDQETIGQPIEHMRASLIRAVGKTADVKSRKGIIEVACRDINKGHCVKQYINRKFVLCAGDGSSDENMFKFDCCSILVGNRPSHAKYRVNTPEELKNVLKRIYQMV